MTGGALTPRPPWAGRRVVLGVTGGIAAYKSIQLARNLTRLGSRVDVVLTEAARAFVTPLSFQGVTGREAHGELFSVEGAALHLRLGSEADAVVVAPATADFIARAAQGRANDLITTVLLAARAPILIAPAMNDRMYAHPQTQSNLSHCRDALGYRIVGPDVGSLAAGEGEGPGRMLEPEDITYHVGRELGVDPVFVGRSVLVTAGPTREPLDPVRFVGNRSSGRMGFAIAREAWLRGADVTLVTGPSPLEAPVGVSIVRVETANEMHAAVDRAVAEADFLFFAAAVSDFRPAHPSDRKIKRRETGSTTAVELVPNPDIALGTRERRRAGAFSVGFALETEDLETGARRKLEEKGFDLIVANDPQEEGAGFDVVTNRVTIFQPNGTMELLPLQSKESVARELLDRVRSIREED